MSVSHSVFEPFVPISSLPHMSEYHEEMHLIQTTTKTSSYPISRHSFDFLTQSSCTTSLISGISASLITQNPLLSLLGFCGCLPQVFAQQRVGNEFQVNTYANSTQENPSVTSLRNGNFVVVWESFDQDGSGYDIFGQLFDSNGNKIQREFQVNPSTKNWQNDPAIISLSNNNFVVVWHGSIQDGVFVEGIFGQFFAEDGSKLGSAFQLFEQVIFGWSVTKLNNGNFVGVRESYDPKGIFGQLFTENGNKIEGEFQVNRNTNDVSNPSVTRLSNDNFVVVWKSYGQDGSDKMEIIGQLFAENGSKIGIEFQANKCTNSYQVCTANNPSSTSLNNGNFIVTWNSYRNKELSSEDGEGATESHVGRIFGQLFDEDGNKIRSEFQIHKNARPKAAVTSLDNSKFVVVWEGYDQSESSGIFGQLFTGARRKIRSKFQINTYTNGTQENPSVTNLSNGNFVVVWESYGQDGSRDGIFGQIFDTSASLSSTVIQITMSVLGGVCFFSGMGYFLYRLKRKNSDVAIFREQRASSRSSDSSSGWSSDPERGKVHKMEPIPTAYLSPSMHSRTMTPSSSQVEPSTPTPYPSFSPPVSSSLSPLFSKEELKAALAQAITNPEMLEKLCQFLIDCQEMFIRLEEQEQAFQIKTSEQRLLLVHSNTSVGDYYETLWMRLSDTILACKVMHSEMVSKEFGNHFDTASDIISTICTGAKKSGELLGKEIPGLSFMTHLLTEALNFFSGPEKARAVQNLSMLVREIGNIDVLTEEVARRLAKERMQQLEQMTDGSQTSWKDRCKKRWQHFRAKEFTTEAKKLAIQDAMALIKAVAQDKTGMYQEPDLVEKLVRCVLTTQ